jgi:hypothetical protein
MTKRRLTAWRLRRGTSPSSDGSLLEAVLMSTPPSAVMPALSAEAAADL